jgi:spermidine synthase
MSGSTLYSHPRQYKIDSRTTKGKEEGMSEVRILDIMIHATTDIQTLQQSKSNDFQQLLRTDKQIYFW